MGREWFLGGGDKSTKREKRENSSSCMSAVFQLFDFQQFHPCFTQHQPSFQPHTSFLPHDDTIILKGVEAPRNSLESEKVIMAIHDAPFSPVIEKDLNIPMGIQIKTNTTIDGSSSESSYSPSTKTPNLVARLMGLDLLPSLSPTSSSSPSNHPPPPHDTPSPLRNSHLHHQISRSCRRTYSKNDIMGTRSLPETPRVSSERKSDVDRRHHHRLSLQINREKVMENDENRPSSSPGHYARQIVKQVRESVGRRVGLDITNTIKNRSSEEIRRDEHLLGTKVKKCSKNLVKVVVGDELNSTKHTTTPNSCSPRLRLFEYKNKSITSPSSSFPPPSSSISTIENQSNLTKVLVKTRSQQPQQQYHEQQQSRKCIQRSKKVTGERFKSRLEKSVRSSEIVRRNKKKEEQFVRPPTVLRAKYSDNKTPLSNDLLNVTVQTFLPVKKDPSPPASKLPQKQVANVQEPKRDRQLSSYSSLAFKQGATHTLAARANKDDVYVGWSEFQYITKILKCIGIDKDTKVSFTKWFSPSHPLDPSIFNHLESTFSTTTTAAIVVDQSGQLGHRCNRRMLFHLVDEILVEILGPYINMKPWVWSPLSMHHDHDMKGSQLIENLCARIRSFPMANCKDLQDIDALVERDLHEPPASNYKSSVAFEEEGESIVSDMEKEIIDSLVHETVVLYRGWEKITACNVRAYF